MKNPEPPINRETPDMHYFYSFHTVEHQIGSLLDPESFVSIPVKHISSSILVENRVVIVKKPPRFPLSTPVAYGFPSDQTGKEGI